MPSSYIENNNASNKTRRYLKAASQRQIMLVKTGNQKNKKMLKVNNRNNRKSCEICTNLTIKIPEQRHWRLYNEIKHICSKNFRRTKQTAQKVPSFFFQELQLITVLLLICDSHMSWSTRFVSLKLCVGFSIFESFSFLLKFLFLFKKLHRLFHFRASLCLY